MFAARRKADFSKLVYADDKKEVAEIFLRSCQTYTKFCEDHNIKRGTLAGYVSALQELKNDKIDTFHDGNKGGRPKYLDSIDILDLMEEVRKNTVGNAQKNKTHIMKTEFVKAHNNMNERLRKASDSNKVSDETFYRVCKAEDLYTSTAQTVTNARKVAQEDPRNFFTFGAMCKAMIGMLGLVACMVMNWDATQFVITPDGMFHCM